MEEAEISYVPKSMRQKEKVINQASRQLKSSAFQKPP